MEDFLRLVCAAAMVSALAAFGWTLTLRVDGCARLARWILAFVASTAAATLVFLVLAVLRILSVPTMLVSAMVLAAGGARFAGRERIARAFADDVAAMREVPKRIGRSVLVALGVVSAAYLVLAGAAACSPILGFDSNTYHLLHVGYWAQDGGFARHLGVDSWGYYEFHPIGGEILWAWVAIPTRSSVLVGPAGVFLVAMTGLATISAARSLGATLERAVLAAAALVSIPAISTFATSGYVDNTALVLVAAATALLFAAIDAASSLRRVLLVGSSTAFGLAVGVKTPPMLPLLALGLFASAVLLIARRARVKEIAGVLALQIAAAVTMFAPRMAYTASKTGSPFYPFPVKFLGREISHGNESLRRIVVDIAKPVPPMSALIRELFFERPVRWPVNFGVAGIGLFTASAIGIAYWIVRRPRDARGLFLVGLMVPEFAFFFGESTVGLRSTWWWVVARFMTPAAFAAVLFATVPKGTRFFRAIDVLLGFAVLAGVYIPLTNGMCSYRWIGGVSVAIGLAGAVTFGVLAWRAKPTPAAVAAFVGIGLAIVGALTLTLRTELEGLVYRGAARSECYEGHPAKHSAPAFPIWERLANAPRATIAVASGWDGIGHEVWRYPLLGHAWQHELVYVTPTSDGKLHDFFDVYMDEPAEKRPGVSYEQWRQRLRDAHVDYVVLMSPYNIIEHQWMAMHPEDFHLEEVPDEDTQRLYSFTPKK